MTVTGAGRAHVPYRNDEEHEPHPVSVGVLFGAGTPIAKLLLDSVSPCLVAGLLYLGCGALAVGGGGRCQCLWFRVRLTCKRMPREYGSRAS